jgi:hypothetical protein
MRRPSLGGITFPDGSPTRIAKHPQHPVSYESSSEDPRIAGMAELADAADSKSAGT